MTDEDFNEWGKIPETVDKYITAVGTGDEESRREAGASVDIEELLDRIRHRFSELGQSTCRTNSFLAHLRSLGRWEADGGDYPDPGEVAFPKILHIAYAVCHRECGVREFIVDGSTQECQTCGDLMFRTEVAEYRLLERSCGQERSE